MHGEKKKIMNRNEKKLHLLAFFCQFQCQLHAWNECRSFGPLFKVWRKQFILIICVAITVIFHIHINKHIERMNEWMNRNKKSWKTQTFTIFWARKVNYILKNTLNAGLEQQPAAQRKLYDCRASTRAIELVLLSALSWFSLRLSPAVRFGIVKGLLLSTCL